MLILIFELFLLLIIIQYYISYKTSKSNKDPDRFSETPTELPVGWYKIPENKEVDIFGKKLVKFDNGNVYSAYCPHLGAKLNTSTKDNCITCPFHGLSFDIEDGTCKQVPQMKLKNPFHNIKVEGLTFIWNSSETPTWMFTLDELKDLKILTSRTDNVHAYIRDICENGADIMHFNVVHSYARILSWLISFRWTTQWLGPDESNPNISNMTIKGETLVFGKIFSPFYVEGTIKQIGPAIVLLSLNTTFGKFELLQTITPIKEHHNLVEHLIFGKDTFWNKIGARIALLGFHDQFSRDIAIWNQKKMLSRPFLISTDGPIKKFREWYSRFGPGSNKKKLN